MAAGLASLNTRDTQPGPGVGANLEWKVRGLVYASTLGDPRAVDAVSGAVSLFAGTRRGAAKHGGVRVFSAATDVVDTVFVTSSRSNVLRTYFVRAMAASTGGNGFGRLWDKGDGTIAESIAFFNGTTLSYGAAFDGTAGVWTIPFTATNTPFTLSISHDLNSASNVPVIYLNGARQTVTTSTPASGTRQAVSNRLQIGNRESDHARNWDGWIADFLIFDRVLPESLQRDLHYYPYQVWEADPEPALRAAAGVTITCTTGAALGAGLAATIGVPVTVAANVGAATGAGLTAGVASAITIACSAGAASAAGLGANISSAITINGSVGVAVGAGLAANVASPITVSASVGAATATGLQASISTGGTVDASTGAAVAAGLAATVGSSITIAASVGAATASGLTAGIGTGSNIAAGTGAAVGAGLPAVVSSPITVTATVGAATATGLQASVGSGSTIPAGIGAAVALGLTAGVSSTYIVVAGVGRAAAAGLQASITSGPGIGSASMHARAQQNDWSVQIAGPMTVRARGIQ